MAIIEHRPKIGLVLSGGGARCFAHIGVIKCLVRAGVPIDCVCGTSMGGIIAGLFCAGIPIDTLESIALTLAKPKELIKLIDLSPPRRGLLNIENVREFLQEILVEEYQIEKLDIPLAMAAVDLRTNKEVCLNSGSLLEAMIATTAFPGLFDPVIIDNKTLVDGGVLNNLPVDLAKELGAEIIIAVDVNYINNDISPWEEESIASRFNTLLPSIFHDVYQAEMIMVSALTENKLSKIKPDFLLRPIIPFSVNIFMGFIFAEQIITAGEEITQQFIPQIQVCTKSRANKLP